MSPGAPNLDDAEAPRRRDRVVGLLIVAIAFCGSLCLSWWAEQVSRPEVPQPPAPATSVGLGGFPKNVDPLAVLPLARERTPRNLLRGIVVEGVGADGTVDVAHGVGSIRYSFQSPPGEGPQPPREPGTLPRRRYCGKQVVSVTQAGIGAERDQSAAGCASQPLPALPEPTCGPKELWAHAIRAGAPDDRHARVEYYSSQVGPAWRFDLPQSRYRFSLGADCRRELSVQQASSLGP